MVLATPAAVAVALSAVDLSTRSLWLDESATVAIASQHGRALMSALAHDGGNMAAYYLLIHVLIVLFGHSTLVLRIPSVLADGVSASATAAIGCRLSSRRVGLGAGLLVAVSLPFVYWAQDARAYSMMYAFGALSYLAFVALVDGESKRRPGRPPRWAWPAYALFLACCLYMSFIAALVIPAQLVSLYWYRRRIVPVCSAVVSAGVLSAPLAVLAYGRGPGQLFWVPKPNWDSAAQVGQALASSALAPSFKNTGSSLGLLALTLAAVLAAGIAGWRRARGAPVVDGVSRQRWAVGLVAAWLVVPSLLDLVESFAAQSIFQSEYLLISAPAVALGLAWWCLETNMARSAGLACLAGLILLRGAQILPTYGVSPEDWRAATSYVLRHARPGDCVAFYPSDGRNAFDYYVETARPSDSSLPRPVLPPAPFSVVKPYVEDYATLSRNAVRALGSRCDRLWLVSSHVGVKGASAQSSLHYERYETLLDRLGSTYPHRHRTQFGYAQAIEVFVFFG